MDQTQVSRFITSLAPDVNLKNTGGIIPSDQIGSRVIGCRTEIHGGNHIKRETVAITVPVVEVEIPMVGFPGADDDTEEFHGFDDRRRWLFRHGVQG